VVQDQVLYLWHSSDLASLRLDKVLLIVGVFVSSLSDLSPDLRGDRLGSLPKAYLIFRGGNMKQLCSAHTAPPSLLLTYEIE